MNAKSVRLRRVMRKYAIDRRAAQLAHASSDAERSAVEAMARQLATARQTLPYGDAGDSIAMVAAVCEWADRLDAASAALQPTRRLSQAAALETMRSVRVATARCDMLAQKIAEATREEDQQAEARTIANFPLRKPR